MRMSHVLIGGNHRGARAIANELQDETIRLYEPDWLLADPKDNRAAQMAEMLTNRFPTLRPQPVQMPVQEAIYSGDHDVVVLALDKIADTLETLQSRLPSQRVSCQFAGRGPNGIAGTRLAIQGTICPGDYETEKGAHLFLHTLSEMSPAVSSRRLTGGSDPLSAAVLQPLRTAASRQTAKHLAEREREPWDLSGGALSVCFGHASFPLYAVQGHPQDTHAQWKDRALDTVSALPANHFLSRGLRGGFAYVSLVIPEARAIHFMKVAQSRTGKRSIAGLTSFVSPRVQQQSQAAAFTD